MIRNLRIFFYSTDGSLVIVTGASSNHFQSLKQLLKSIKEFEPQTECIVYDLGLSPNESIELSETYPQYEMVVFDYSKFPDHVDINKEAGAYAWKPIIIKEVTNHRSSRLLWLDSGDVVIKKLTFLRKYLNCYGFYSAYSVGTIKDWTHPTTLKVLNVDYESYSHRNMSANIVGLNPKFNSVRELVREWNDLALRKEVIAPSGSSRENHRQDQSLLTILAHRMNLAPTGNRGDFHRRIIGIAMHQDVETQ